jgi:hypothetical protein
MMMTKKMMKKMMTKVTLSNRQERKTFLIPFISISSRSRSFVTLSHSLRTTSRKKTYISRPLTVFIPIRFSGNKPTKPIQEAGKKVGSLGTAPNPNPKPIPLSSLMKPRPPRMEPKPMSPKHYNPNNVGGMKPKAPYDPAKDSYLAKPGVAWACQNASSHVNTTATTAQSNQPSSSYVIPVPPPMPPYKPQSFPSNTSTPTISNSSPLPSQPITKGSLNEAKNLLKSSKPLKPSIPQDTKISDVSNDTPQTRFKKIAELATTLTPEDVANEMLGRGLFTLDNAMPIEMLTEAEKIIQVGQGSKYKLSAFGHAHFKSANIPSYMENLVKDNFKVYIGVLKSDLVKYQTSGEIKHMPLIFKIDNAMDNFWYSLGYLTSQPQPFKLGDMQFKPYQDIYYRKLPNNSTKPQYLALFDNAKKISNDQITLLKGGPNYLAFLKQTETINKICEKLMGIPYVNYNPEGLTVEQCIATCMHFDTIVKKKLSHPQTNADIANSAKIAAEKNKIKPVTHDETSE